MRRAVLAAVALFPLAATAETLYVIDRLVVGLRAEPSEVGAVVKSVETGTALEVLERDGTRVRVREPQGGEGWIDARYLAPQPPSRAQITELQSEIKRLRAEAARPAAKADSAPKIAQLETELAQANAKLGQAQAELDQTRAALADARRAPKEQRSGQAPPYDTGSPSIFIWLMAGFAMLGIGFGAGVWWVRESIRRRMGGMYLRM